jgi:pyruvate kinase
MRRTKIVATLGPATSRPDVIDGLLAAGIDVARINFSHGTQTEHLAAIEGVRAASRRADRPVAILADLQGPKIRVGHFVDGAVILTPGHEFTITTEPCNGTDVLVGTSYASLPHDVKPGDHILLDDGRLQLRVTATTTTSVTTRVEVGGVLSDHKGMNLPGS